MAALFRLGIIYAVCSQEKKIMALEFAGTENP